MPAQQRPGERAGDDRERGCGRSPGRLGQLRADPDGHDRAGEVLALAADVEHAAAERERDREPGQDERDEVDQRLLEVEAPPVDSMSFDVPRERDVRVGERDPQLVASRPREPVEPGALEDRLVGAERVLAGRDEDDEAADEEREDHRQQRHDDAARPSARARSRARDARRVVAAGARALDLAAALRRRRCRPAPLTPLPSARRRSSRRRAPPR